MAQVDFVNYFSILFWFFLLLIIYYLINYSILFPSIYSIIVTRYNIYKALISSLKNKLNCYTKNYIFIINNSSYIIFSFFLKKCVYLNII
jgi:hypothetical protein